MEQKENVKPAKFENLFQNISTDSLDLGASLAKQLPSSPLTQPEEYADELARKLLDDTNDLVRSEPKKSVTPPAEQTDTTAPTPTPTTTTTTTTTTATGTATEDGKSVEIQADSLKTETIAEKDEESSKGNGELVREDNEKEQEVFTEYGVIEEPHLPEPLQPKGSELEPEIEKYNNVEVEKCSSVEVEKGNIVEIEGDKPSDGDNSHCLEGNSDSNGGDKENNNNSDTANEDQSATTAAEAVEEVVKEETQQQDSEQNTKPQQSVPEEETVNTEKVDTEEVEEEEEEEEEEEDIDEIVKPFERETESEASISEKEELLLESKEKEEEKQEEEVVSNKLENIAENLKQDTEEMEFAKNYSDDLLMGQSDQAELPSASAGADLADFELPPYSGSSSGSEPRQHSPVKRKSSSASNSTAQQQASSSSKQVNVAPPDLTAVKNLLMSSYSKVSHIFHWKKPIETGLYFSIGATLIIALTFFSIISVVAYSALGLIAASSLIRLYKVVMMTLGKSTETPFDHVWDKVLSLNVSLSHDKMHQILDASLGNLNSSLVYFKQVLLVEDKFATLKFGVFLYLLTYIGAWFNGMTLITITYLALFSVPIFYEKNKTKIDEYVNLANGQISSVINMVTGKVSSTLFGGNNASSSVSKKQN